MKTRIAAALLLLFAGAVLSQEVPEARELISRYLAAALAGDGDAAAGCLSAETFLIWDELVAAAQGADRQALKKLSLYRQFSVLWIRSLFAGLDLQALTGHGYVRLSYSRGYHSQSAIEKLRRLTQVFPWRVMRRGTAGVLAYQAGSEWKEAGGLWLVEEKGGWKIDGADQFAAVESRLEQQWRESGSTREEFVARFYSAAAGKPLDEALWRPRSGSR